MKHKKITRIATLLLVLVNVGLFSLIWLRFYNYSAFRTHRMEGAIGTIIVYYIIYRWLSKLYRGYSIASTAIEETVLSQFISFGLSDLALYVACCLLARHYVNVVPGALIVLLQLILSTVIIWIAKSLLLRHIKPAPTLLIYGGRQSLSDAKAFIGRLVHKYGHLFNVSVVLSENAGADAVETAIQRARNVIFMGVNPARRAEWIEFCLQRNRVFYFVPEFADIVLAGCAPKNLLDTPLMRYDYNYDHNRNFIVKRLFDILLSLFFLILLSPLMLVLALLIHLEDGGSVFYRQERVTMGGKKFNILKFRSMVPDAEKYGAVPATRKDPRITRIGRFMRPLRLDETPQFINVLLGQMSFVGPRPERLLHVQLYEKELPEFHYRLRVKGGLTGYAQVYGKYNTSPEDKLKLDMLYIENQSFLLDFKLIMLTIKTMFRPESTEGFDEATSESIHAQDARRPQ